MSKQSEAKTNQRYFDKPIPRTCSYCKHFTQTFYHYSRMGERIEGVDPNKWKTY